MPDGHALTSGELAELIIDALVDAGLIDRASFEVAVSVATTEIDVRKTMGDYSEGSARRPSRPSSDLDQAG